MASFSIFDSSDTGQVLIDGETGFIGQLSSLSVQTTAVKASGSVSLTVL
jgi:hypothetical protein